ncbi:hypothetical protein GCM10010502_68830 [Kitasatospora aureofaciens]|uniref:Uncharacterized protein n=1 Tax=Kitasatospora aureofaciens TaxID=1894 RepID=A0A8H9HZW4_KITAU|nr:hypothetical protein GCM10010502_68830 [Kitasatospora aureofaciens]
MEGEEDAMPNAIAKMTVSFSLVSIPVTPKAETAARGKGPAGRT